MAIWKDRDMPAADVSALEERIIELQAEGREKQEIKGDTNGR